MLASRADDKGMCFPSHDLIAEDCGMDKRSAIRQVDKLESIGYLRVARAKKGSHQVNRYVLDLGLTSDRESPVQVTESHSVSDRESPVQVTESHTKQSIETINETVTLKATAKENLEIENESLKNKIAELEKKVVAAKSKNETSLPEFKKQTADEIAQAQSHLDRFVNAEPFTAPTSPNDIELTHEQLGCFQWAINHDYWKQYAYNKSVFIKTLNKTNGGMKPQYEQWLSNLQAQKSPNSATNTNQGLMNNPNNNSGVNYATQPQLSQPRKLSLAERAAAATERAIEFERKQQNSYGNLNDYHVIN